MTDVNIDVERRVELATLELLREFSILTALVATAQIRVRTDTSEDLEYPAAVVEVIMSTQFGDYTGWYQCALQLGALTYRLDDTSRAVCKQILGALRGWAQQTDLHTQFNATDIAKASATALDVRYTWLDGGSFDDSDDRVHDFILPVAVLCRPTQAETE